MKINLSERGQATLEFIIIFPLLLTLGLLMVTVTAIWHGHHLALETSIEGASVAGYDPGKAIAVMDNITSQEAPGFGFSSGFTFGTYGGTDTIMGDFIVVRSEGATNGIVGLPYGATLTSNFLGSTSSPVWEFIP